MSNSAVGPLLEALRSPDSRQNAWAEFLECYSPVLYQSARIFTSEPDAAADCYLHICERLSRNGFRRLLKFRPEGSASFTTWLRVVARNLCVDWHRSRFGRQRPFKSLQQLSPLELEVYDSRLVHGRSQQETLERVETLSPGLDVSELSEIEERLQRMLSSRQQWTLSTRWHSESSLEIAHVGEEEDARELDVADPRPNQEELLLDRQIQQELQQSLASLPARDRLLVQLRFEQELSLDEIARLCGLQDAQRAHRALATILRNLRDAMQKSSGKSRDSVRGIRTKDRPAGYPLPQSGEGR